jgi:hypothetical protein
MPNQDQYGKRAGRDFRSSALAIAKKPQKQQLQIAAQFLITT